MFWFIVILAVVLIVIIKSGVYRTNNECKHCHKELKGTEQIWFGKKDKFCLCEECASKVHPQIMKFAKKNWDYLSYTDYLNWEEETEELRSQFEPDFKYGNHCELSIDSYRGLFKLTKRNNDTMIFRFDDLIDYEMNFRPEKVKEGVFGEKVKGEEYGIFKLSRPYVELEEVLNIGVHLELIPKGIINKKYEYQLSRDFMNAIMQVEICDRVQKMAQ